MDYIRLNLIIHLHGIGSGCSGSTSLLLLLLLRRSFHTHRKHRVDFVVGHLVLAANVRQSVANQSINNGWQDQYREFELRDELSLLLVQDRVRSDKSVVGALCDSESTSLLVECPQAERKTGVLLFNFIEEVPRRLHLEFIVHVHLSSVNCGSNFTLFNLSFASAHQDVYDIHLVLFKRHILDLLSLSRLLMYDFLPLNVEPSDFVGHDTLNRCTVESLCDTLYCLHYL